MAILRFAVNIPQVLHLHSLEGRIVESKFGGNQYLFTAKEGAFYVGDKVGAILMDQFKKLDVRPGDEIEITKAEVGHGTDRRTNWIVTQSAPAPAAGEQPDGTFVVPTVPVAAPEPPSQLEQQLAASIRMVEARKQAQSATTAAPAWADYLVAQSNALIDAYASVLKHSVRHEGLIKT